MKSYLRFEPTKTFGIITSPQCNTAVFDWSGNLALCGALQDVLVWNLRQSSCVATLSYNNPNYPYHEIGSVTTLVRSPDQVTVGAGYLSGEIILYNYMNKTTSATFRGHKTAVTALSYDKSGTQLVSGGADTDIYIWDTISLAGVARLRGHKGAITGLAFVEQNEAVNATSSPQYLVSTSKDTLLKVWNLSSHHCVQTIVGHRGEIWCLATTFAPISADVASFIAVTGSADDMLRAYKVKDVVDNHVEEAMQNSDDEEILEYFGSVKLDGGEKCTALCFSNNGYSLVALSGPSSKTLELFKLRDILGIKKKIKRRIKRTREKGLMDTEISSPEILENEGCVLADLLEPCSTMKSQHKMKSVSFSPSKGGDGAERLLVATSNNSLELIRITVSDIKSTDRNNFFVKQSVLELHGHRSDVRSLCISSDGLLIASCSGEGTKIWSAKTFSCLRNCNTGYGVSMAFVTGNRYLVLGTKAGNLQLLDASSGEVTVDFEDAHDGAIWSVAMNPIGGKGFMTGGADKLVRFWDFSVSDGKLGIKLTRQLQMTHDILSVKYSPVISGQNEDRLLVAVGLLDHTIKVFYEDSLKFFLSLYGHKLPVMCMDISYDSNILVSGSADKTVKIWGLDFGDCHRSLIAHEDSVTNVRFQPKTHYFFSSGKDGIIKYWDADRFEQILYLPGHLSAVWGLDVSSDAAVCVSSGQDRSLRVWSKTEDLVFIEEEKERALEAQAELSMEKRAQHDTLHSEGSDAVAVSSLPSIESLKSGERVMEAIVLVENELVELMKEEKNAPSLLLRGMHPLQYMCWTLKVGVKFSELEMALLTLPFHMVQKLLYILYLVCQTFGTETELCARCVVFLLRCHHMRIASSSDLSSNLCLFCPISLGELLQQLQQVLRSAISSYRCIVGTNVAAVKYSVGALEAKRAAYHVDDVDLRDDGMKKKRKKAGRANNMLR